MKTCPANCLSQPQVCCVIAFYCRAEQYMHSEPPTSGLGKTNMELVTAKLVCEDCLAHSAVWTRLGCNLCCKQYFFYKLDTQALCGLATAVLHPPPLSSFVKLQ